MSNVVASTPTSWAEAGMDLTRPAHESDRHLLSGPRPSLVAIEPARVVGVQAVTRHGHPHGALAAAYAGGDLLDAETFGAQSGQLDADVRGDPVLGHEGLRRENGGMGGDGQRRQEVTSGDSASAMGLDGAMSDPAPAHVAPASGLSPTMEDTLAHLATSLPAEVPREQVLWHCRFVATLAGIEGARDEKETTARACAHIEDAEKAIRQMRALLQAVEAEARRMIDVLYGDFDIAHDPAFAALHAALLGAMAARH